MKTTQITIILFVLISLFTYSSCSKDGEENPIPGTPDNGKITAKIDGNRFESEYTATTLLDSILNIPYVYITGYDNSSQLTASEAIAIGIVSNPGPITTGNYTQSNEDCDITQTNSICVFITYFDINNTDAINDGVYGGDIEDSSSQVRVTDIDYRSGGFVRGTFSGTLVNEDTGETINITDGEFNVAIQ